MKDYINIVLSKINNKNQKVIISEELKGHIEDRKEYYINAGYDEETAKAKANEHMGSEVDAELTGEQLEEMHTAVYKNIFKGAAVLVNLFALLVLLGNFWVFPDSPAHSFLHLILLSSFILLTYLELFAALKWKSFLFAISAVVMQGVYGLLTECTVPAVFCFSEISSGKGKSLTELLLFYVWRSDNAFIKILNVLFLLFSVAVSVAVFIHIMKFKKLRNGRNYYKKERIIKIIICSLASFVLFVSVFTCFFVKQQSLDTTELIDGFYFLESDEIVNPEELENYDNSGIYFSYDIFENNPDLDKFSNSYEEKWDDDRDWNLYWDNFPIKENDIDINYVKYESLNSDCKYKTYDINAEFYTDKKYIMIIPFVTVFTNDEDRDIPCFDNGIWVEVSDGKIVESNAEYYHNGAIINCKIKLFAIN